MSLRKGEELFAEGDEAEYFYKVVSGAIRSYKLLSDGRRQIDAFHLPGDIFGLEAGAEHRFSAEAVGNATVIAYRRAAGCRRLIAEDPAFREQVMTAMLRSLERAQDHMLLLGRKTAQEKVASFLLDMAERIAGRRGAFRAADAAQRHRRPSRPHHRDRVADLNQFDRAGLIRLPAASRSIAICNKMALRDLDA